MAGGVPFRLVVAMLSLSGIAEVRAEEGDCNANGIPDAVDLTASFDLAAPRFYPAAGEPTSAGAADLDGDARLDLAVIDRAAGALAVLLNDGRGGLGAPATFPAGDAPVALEAADLDGDSRNDLSVISGGFPAEGGLSLLRGLGAGRFSAPEAIAAPANPTAVAARDLDGDGAPDLAVLTRDPDGIALWWNRGGGGFDSGELLPAGRGPAALTAADLDGDGDPDLAAANQLAGTLSVFLNLGQRRFSMGAAYPTGRLPNATASADLNGDGLADLAVASRSPPALQVFLGAADGTLAARIPRPLSAEPAAAAAGDLDGDGRPELAVLANTLGAGRPVDSNVEPRAEVTTFESGVNGAISEIGEAVVGPRASWFGLFDLEGDGLADLAALHPQAGGLSVLSGRAGGSSPGPICRPVYAPARPLAAGDFDGDRRPDLIILNDALMPVWILPAGADGRYAGRRLLQVTRAVGVAPGDLDGDGEVDAAFAVHPAPWEELPPLIRPFWNDGAGKLQAGEDLLRSSRFAGFLAADFDLDGSPDLAIPDTGKQVSFLWNRGARRFEEGPELTLEKDPGRPGAADLDGDGDPDLVLVLRPELTFDHLNPDGTPSFAVVEAGGLAILRNDGRGAFSDGGSLAADSWPNSVAAADLDRDGDLELAAADQEADHLAIWRNDGRGVFDRSADLSGVPGATSIVAADADGDGAPDLAAGSLEAPEVYLFRSVGDGSFSSPERFAVSGPAREVLALVPDGGGAASLAVLTDITQDLWVLSNRSRPPLSADCNRNGRPDDCDLASGASADRDGDGVPDECGARFRRGDTNADGTRDVSDAVHLLGFLFLGTPPALECERSGDADAGGTLDLSDGVALLVHLFLDGPAPAEPYAACGFDTASPLRCLRHPPCE